MVSLSTGCQAEGSQVVRDVHEQTVRCLREVVADSHTLIISPHDDVEEILLALVIAIAAVVMVATLHQVDNHLVIMVADR